MNLPRPATALHRLLFGLLILLALYFRASGLFHGLPEQHVFHPDTPKQILNLQEGLQGNHLIYYGNLFYDGYPYGLNRIDEILLRTARLLTAPVHTLLHGRHASLPPPDRTTLFYHARLLRLLYGITALLLLVKSVSLLTQNRWISLATLALCAAAPLAATVTHSATGDIGPDLFLSLTLLHLGLRAGARPAHLTARLGPRRLRLSLAPHSQTIIPLTLGTPRQTAPATQNGLPPTEIRSLTLETSLGPVWIELLTDPAHQTLYKAFGPDAPQPPPALDHDARNVHTTLRFLDNTTPTPLQSPRHSLFDTPEGLPAGSYQLQLTLLNPHPSPAPFQIALHDPLEPHPALTSPTFSAPPGLSTHTHTLHKPFAPFETDLRLLTPTHGLTLQSWTLLPHPDQTPPPPAIPPAPPFTPLQLHYPPGLRLTGLHLTLPDTPDAPLTWAVRAETDPDLPQKRFDEAVIFLHLLNQNQQLLHVLEMPLETATFSDTVPRLRTATLPAAVLEAETLHIRIGVYTPKNRLRLRPEPIPLLKDDFHDHTFRVHTFTQPDYAVSP